MLVFGPIAYWLIRRRLPVEAHPFRFVVALLLGEAAVAFILVVVHGDTSQVFDLTCSVLCSLLMWTYPEALSFALICLYQVVMWGLFLVGSDMGTAAPLLPKPLELVVLGACTLTGVRTWRSQRTADSAVSDGVNYRRKGVMHMERRMIIMVCLAILTLSLVTVVLNNFRWSYYRDGVYCVDKWLGRAFPTNSKDAPVRLWDTAKYVFGAAGGVALLAALLSLAIGRKNTQSRD